MRRRQRLDDFFKWLWPHTGLLGLVLCLMIVASSCAYLKWPRSNKWSSGNDQQIELAFSDSTLYFEVTSEFSGLDFDPSKKYSFFDGKKVLESTVPVSKRVLDGSYLVLDRDDNFLIKGNYEQGLRSGVWVRNTGITLTKLTFERGNLDGDYEIFEGKTLQEKGKYNNGQKQGEVKYYLSDTLYMIVNFNKGVIQDTLSKN